MIVLEEAHNTAVALGKSENMRVTAGRMFAAMVTALPEIAQQVIEAGEEPTIAGLWTLVADDPAYPAHLGKSFSTGRLLLRIGKAKDPEAADRADRERDRTASYKSDADRSTNVTDYRKPPPVREELPILERPHVQEFLAAWHALHPDEQEYVLPQLQPMRF